MLDLVTEILPHNIVNVKFIKKDGTNREMICTLKEDFLPKTKGNGKNNTKENLITVWCLDCNNWRIINIDTIITWEICE